MSVLGKIGNFFKEVGHLVKAAFVGAFGPEAGAKLATAAEEWLKTELGQLSMTVVSGLESAAGSPADKQQQAFTQIGSQLAAQGKSVPASLVNFGIEFALQILRGSAAKA